MNNQQKEFSDGEIDNDFAVIQIESNYVVLEANTWDLSTKSHRKTILYLHPMEAKLLAGQLQRNAVVAETKENA